MQNTRLVVDYLGNGEYNPFHSVLQKGSDQKQCSSIQYESKLDHTRGRMLYENKPTVKDDCTLSTLNYSKGNSSIDDLYGKTLQPTENEHRSHPFDPKILNEQNASPVQNMLRGILNKDKAKRDRKVVHPQAKELILNVVNFMKQEANGEFVIPARKVQCRAAMATGFSERTVRRVVKESKSLPVTENSNGEGSSVSFPPKKVPKRPKPKTGLDSLTRCAVRKIVHRIYVNEKTVPTIKKIHQKLVDEIGFKGGSRSAHKIVKGLGFYWKKTKAKSFVLIEKHEIRLKRIEYLRDMTRLRHEGRPVVYVAETTLPCRGSDECIRAITAGSEQGFVPGSLFSLDTHDEIVKHATTWVRETLLPALPPCTVVVLDGGVFAAEDFVPTLHSDAETMKRWLTTKGINFRPDMLRPELHQVIRRNAGRIRKNKGVVEQLLTEMGHCVLRIPPDHPDLNPAALIWADVRRAVDERGGGNLSETRALAELRLAELGADAWRTRCAQVRNVEQQYLASEGIVDAEVERVLAAAKDPGSLPDESDDLHDNNINFVRHFMGGLLGLDDHKLYSA